MGQEGSAISQQIKKTGKILQGGAAKQVQNYQSRFKRMEDLYGAFLHKLMQSYPADSFDPEFMERFFGKRRLRFAGIDGTVYKKDMFDLVIFFAGAYSVRGEMEIKSSGDISVKYNEKYLDSGIGISSVLPLYINEVVQVDQTILRLDEFGEVDTAASYSDSWVIDNSAVADYLMGLSEFYLAYKLVRDEHPVDVLFMDRICSSEISSFYAETSHHRVNLDRQAGLIGYKIDRVPFSKSEWILARTLIGDRLLGTPPARGEYFLSAVVSLLLELGDKGITLDELETLLNINNDKRRKTLEKALAEGLRKSGDLENVLIRKNEAYLLNPRFRSIFERLDKLVTEVCERIFAEDDTLTFEERYKVGDRWLTTTDLSFLSLIALYLTMRKAWKNKTLLIGVAKDSSARDLKRQVIPVLDHVGVLKASYEHLNEVPDTDRMILQWVSLLEHGSLEVPWATIEYDTAFKTVVPHFGGKKGKVSGARRNQISLEKTFVKSYFQLSQAESDPKLRSNVLLYDRLVFPEVDLLDGHTVSLEHDYYNNPDQCDPIELILYMNTKNPMQAFVIRMMKALTSKNIPEEFGHIRPLFLADKVAKYYYGQFKAMVESTGSWLFSNPQLREFLFYLSTFRERRSDIERTRRIV